MKTGGTFLSIVLVILQGQYANNVQIADLVSKFLAEKHLD